MPHAEDNEKGFMAAIQSQTEEDARGFTTPAVGGSQGTRDTKEVVVGSGFIVPGTMESTPTTWSRLSRTSSRPFAHPTPSQGSRGLVPARTSL